MKQRQQTGFSLLGMLFWAGMVAGMGLLGVQVVPTVKEYWVVTKAVKKAAAEARTEVEVQEIFDRAAYVDSIKSIAGRDLTITTVGDKRVVSFAYIREIHLSGPAYLTLKYKGSSP